MKNKKLILCLQFVFCLLVLSNFTTLATSHTPDYLDLSYNRDTTTLTATFTHPVADPNIHYINSVEIKLNDIVVDTISYTSQPITDEFSYEYSLSASEGDELIVTGICNQGGSIFNYLLIGNTTISETSRSLPDDNGNETDPTIPGFNLSIVLISSMGIIFIVFPQIKKKMKVIR